MASYQARKRDPLLDSNTQAVIEKRGRELLGLAFIVVGLLFAAMVVSYSADDPSWISATDAPVQNWMGRLGASTAATLMMIVGKGIWVVPLLFVGWGVRFMTHIGSDRAVGRVIFAPIAVAIASIYAATLTAGLNWPPNFGLGGLFGDTALGIVLEILPFGPIFSVKMMSFLMGIGLVALLAFVLGFVRAEVKAGVRIALIGCVMLYAAILRLVGQGASVAASTAQGVGGTIAARREQSREQRAIMAAQAAEEAEARAAVPAPDARARAAAVVRANPAMPVQAAMASADGRKMPPMSRHQVAAEPALTAPARVEPAPAPAPQSGGFLAGLLKRNEPMPEPELVAAAPAADSAAPDGDRVSARISDAIRSRAGGIVPKAVAARIEPRLTGGKGPRPLLLNTDPVEVPAEAPVAMDVMIEAEDEAVIMEDAAPAPRNAPFIRKNLPKAEATPLTAEPLYDTAAPVAAPVPEAKKVVQHPLKRATMPSKQALAESQPKLAFEDKYADYEIPPLSLLTSPSTIERHHLSDEALEENARMLESVLDDYGVKGEIVSVRPGPVVTMYELEPAPGLKASRVIGLADDIARSMSALSARVSTVPGRSVIGIELPNENREMVVLREMLSARDFGDSNMKLPLALGKDIGGEPIIANLAKMPHLLIAGTTGSGKSVAINTMILSLLYKLTPEECRMIMIDPKMLELSVYDGIPHLLSPVVTDPKKAVVALKWVVGEMEERYRKMSKMGVRNIDGYNGRVKDALAKDEMFSRTVQTGFDDETGEPVFETEEFQPEVLPYIVVIVDEMADLMMVAGKEIEACIQRLAQMARASGIHLIMATQRPSVDVITGTIKANFPTRISFQVTSKIDSRTILGEQGAEQLLGMGDMLYMAGGSKITRVHGPFCSDEEVEEIVNHLKGFGPPEYMSGVVEGPSDDEGSSIDLVLGLGDGSDSENALYDTAVAIVIKDRKCSTSYIQRKLAIGYNKAARLVEQMEDEGVVSSANHVGKREILVPEQH
ncbi:DNA translocase FtsK [Yoonia sp. 208BN28-4]|uniref:DNA translocase FtsK n=1 Tax=Yoonia sp. 208BN28-4 TaxID=3126505 RepID=UPI003097F1B2